jgi:predicted GNAT family acetyltransferase
MAVDVRHDQTRHQFIAQVAGGEASLKYRKTAGTLDIYSTFVPDEARGMKVAEFLLQAALQMARDENLKIIPSCSYVSVWFRRHPDQSQLLKNPL